MIPLVCRISLMIVVAWLAAVFDLSAAHWLAVRQCAPNACLLAACVSIACSERRYTFLTAGWFGLVSDIAGVGPMGPAMGSFALIGFLLLELRKLWKQSAMLRQGLEILIGATAMAMSLVVINGLMTPPDAWSTQLQLAVGTSIYSAALATPLVLIAAGARPKLQPHAPTL